jgi:hypothetical protein
VNTVVRDWPLQASFTHTHTRQTLVQPTRHLLASTPTREERTVPVVNLRAAETNPQAISLRVYKQASDETVGAGVGDGVDVVVKAQPAAKATKKKRARTESTTPARRSSRLKDK